MTSDTLSKPSPPSKTMAQIFFFAVLFSIAITVLPLYTIQYISIDNSLTLMIGLEFIASLILYIFYLRHLDDFKSKPSRRVTILSGLSLAAIQFTCFLIFVHENNVSPVHTNFLTVLSLVFLIPFYEEIIYRGCLFGLIRYFSKSILISSLVTSLVFSLMHTQYTSISAHFIMFMISTILVNVRVRTNGMLYPILLHSCMNAIIIILNTQIAFR